MDVIFADDARQSRPSREGVGQLVAFGGIYVPGGSVANLENKLAKLCDSVGFPPGEEFKWSPDKESWMYSNLQDKKREEFFIEALKLARKKQVKAIVAIEDKRFGQATDAETHELDVAYLFLERAEMCLSHASNDGIVIVDRPGGGKKEENRLRLKYQELRVKGTDYVKLRHIALPVLTAPSTHVRLLQLADVITSCTTACVAGEKRYAPRVFRYIKKLLLRRPDRRGNVGGVGLKIYPSHKYVNLYHWLLGDTHHRIRDKIIHLPSPDYPYASSPDRH